MAKRIEGVDERLLESAKREFLAKGFMDASLRTVAAEAGTSTNSIYVRFGGKEGLFAALVDGPYEYVLSRFRQAQEAFAALSPERQPRELSGISGACMEELLRYMHEHMDAFELILTRSEGTRYAHLLDDMVEIETEGTERYIHVLENLGRPAPQMDRDLEHILITGMFRTFFEMIIHRWPLEKSETYLQQMRAFYTAGWMRLLNT